MTQFEVTRHGRDRSRSVADEHLVGHVSERGVAGSDRAGVGGASADREHERRERERGQGHRNRSMEENAIAHRCGFGARGP